MFAKLLALLMIGVVTAGSLLVVRQQRIREAGKLMILYEQTRSIDEDVWRVRAEIAARTTPEQIAHQLEGLGPFAPAPGIWCERTSEVYGLWRPSMPNADPPFQRVW